jgi:hypothetical protein
MKRIAWLGSFLLRPNLVLAVYCLAAVVATLLKLAPGPFVEKGIHYRPLQNFAIFRDSFEHLIHHQNLYAAFRATQWDLYCYSPTFALLFAPFALLPYAVGAVLWNLLNAAALFWAVRSAPMLDERRKMLALWFLFLAMLNSIQNAQSNALIAALMIGAWNAQQRDKADYSALFIVLATFIKLFGVFALLPCLLIGNRKRLLRYTVASGALFAFLPLFVVRFGELRLLYRDWYEVVRAFRQTNLGISILALLKIVPVDAVVAVGAVILIVTAVLGRRAPMLVLASVLIFVTIFNYTAESPSYVIAVSGVALWYFSQARTPVNLALFIATFLLAMVSSTEIVPRALRRDLLDPYVVKALPCILVWIKLQWDFVRASCVSLKDTVLKATSGVRIRAMKRIAWLDSFLLLLLASTLVWPLFRLEYLDNWPSIESTFIADARMLASRLPHPGWQPLWYCGTRFDYIYPPALRYGTALISRFAGVSPARAYHFYTGVLYVLGIVAVYWLVRLGSGSRGGAWLASLGTALLSPSFLLLPIIRHDSPYWIPQRLHVLMTYGEGPHISALCVLPAALALSFVALRGSRPLALAGAAVLCAFTVANNFYGATALAIFFPILAWAVWLGDGGRVVWLRATGIAVLAYSLSAFWLTPSYLRVTTENLALVAPPGQTGPRLIVLAAIVIFCAATWRWARHKPERVWTVFVAGATLFLSLYVLGLYYFGFHAIGDAARLIPELDLALVLALAGLVTILWRRPKLRALAVVIPLLAVYPAIRYVRHSRSPFAEASHIENQYEYRVSQWAHEHLADQRVLPSGTVRFWFNAWFDNPQLDGGSMQGVENGALPAAAYQITAGDRGQTAILWMQALGTDAVIVPDRTSPEPYHDYQYPYKFRGLAPVLYDDQHGTVIYRIPRIYPGIGRVVNPSQIAAIGPVRGGDDFETLSRYVAVVENPQQGPTQVTWRSFDEARLQAHVSAGQAILFEETYDPSWRAYENGRSVPIRPEPVMNFMLLAAPEGDHVIQLRFETPTENQVGRVISMLGFAVLAGLIWGGFARR